MSLSDVEIARGQRIEIKVSIETLEEDAREELFVKAEEELGILLRNRFGYTKPFDLIVKI